MTGMLDIARSGLSAYRTALAVTAENIANVETEGYQRREVATVSAAGAQATATTRASGGQGVSVLEVRRAFDALAAERLRGSSAARTAAEIHLSAAEAVEALMIPGEDGIDGVLRDMFAAFGDLAGAPTDIVTRQLALNAADASAGALRGLAAGLDGLRGDLVAEAGAVADTATALLANLATLSRQIGNLGGSSLHSAAAAPLYDQRDAMLGQLSDLLPVAVSLDATGRPDIRLGSAAGPVLLDGHGAARLSVAGTDPLTLVSVAADGTSAETRALAGGAIAGLSRGIGAVDMAVTELDGFARDLAAAVNAVHAGGVDLTGAPGGAVYALSGWQARPAAANGGLTQVTLTATATATGTATGGYELVFDAAGGTGGTGSGGTWRAFDAAGTEVAAGMGRLVLDGVTVDLAGAARDGDRIALAPVEGHARDLTLVIRDPRALAAAAAFELASDPANTGTATLAAAVAAPSPSGLATVAALLDAGPADLLGGVIGVLPAGTASAELLSLGQTARTRLPLTGDETQLAVTIDGAAHLFDLTGIAGAEAIATALRSAGAGGIVSSTGRSLASLGLVAEADAAGELNLWRPGAADAAAATATGPGGVVTGTLQAAVPAGGTVQVITRSGRHVAGAPLSAAEAAALLTPANGFLPGAVYDPAPLTAGGTGYRGIGVAATRLPGGPTVTLPGAAATGPAPLPATAARDLVLTGASGSSAAVALPEGASAALAASLLRDALPGLAAEAVTALTLSDVADGTLRLSVAGRNVAPLEIEAAIGGGRLDPLAAAFNRETAVTGIRAELSPDGSRLLLVQEEGHDIALTLGAGAVQVTPAAPDGTAAGTATGLVAGQSLRQSGQLRLTGVEGFALAEGAAVIASAPGDSGLWSIDTSRAGASAQVTFAPVGTGVEGGLAYALEVGGLSVAAALPAGATGAEVAATMAAALRATAPAATVTGAALAALPADGTTLALRLEGADYRLTMLGGRPVIEGPEPGRIAAAFDAGNRLVLTAKGVTGGAGIEVAAAAAFGLSAGAGARQVLAGGPVDAAALPAALSVTLAGTTGTVTLSAGAVEVTPELAALGLLASRDPEGRLVLDLPAPAVAVVALSAAAGFGGPPAAVRVEGAALALDGSQVLGLTARVAGSAAQGLQLTGLPDEELIVALTGSGTLRLAGSVVEGGGAAQGPLTVQILDAGLGTVALFDGLSGDRIATGWLDAGGTVTLGGHALRIDGAPATGDRFTLQPTAAGSADATTARALAALAEADPATGAAGLAARFGLLQSDAGVRAAAAGRASATATAAADAAERAVAAIGAVDLDTEAARLVELQQAYQASAQALSIARDMFQTLLDMI
ncbi:FlgK family flagellar hook-associated protein [Frigidibacter oleivorans]|uniref:FlgK family flagellar hook-associated protein n=1 Tax=Frigidibacter oleivorans TaxID=2487129 RepID=UPI000F8F19FC|nr:flagellar basal body protein [Frigidibacter oleivorans]